MPTARGAWTATNVRNSAGAIYRGVGASLANRWIFSPLPRFQASRNGLERKLCQGQLYGAGRSQASGRSCRPARCSRSRPMPVRRGSAASDEGADNSVNNRDEGEDNDDFEGASGQHEINFVHLCVAQNMRQEG